ncbi:MAG: RNA polymerase sigma-70 factor (ECF subfamily) [Candidatus Paceibacteria bacterium]|jgi:RNA polymerase sigma-70 factor (ECF subfamily)
MDPTSHQTDRLLAEYSIEHLFGKYRVTGRPCYLAEVFDRTSPELLRVALHLSRDANQAEDLVQSTFLEAIRSARRFTVGRRVLPWLTGILSNMGREARRQSARRPELLADPRPEPADPLQQASDAELEKRLDDELSCLEEPYRTVMLLHVRHALSPAEIASVVKCSPATVRSQLSRGRDQLQKRLPAAAPMLLGLPESAGRGLQAVRGVVVRRAFYTAPGILASAAFYLVGAHPLAAGLLALLAVLPLTNAVEGIWGPGETLAPQRLRSAEPANAVALPASIPASQLGRRVALSLPEEALESCSLTVKVVQDDVPLRGVSVRLRRLQEGDALFHESCVKTDERGEVHFVEQQTGAIFVALDRARGHELVLHSGAHEELTLDLSGGRQVAGVVQSPDGMPIAGAAVWLGHRWAPDAGMVVERTDDAGRFELEGVEWDFMVAAFSAGYAPCAPVSLSDGASDACVLVLDRPGCEVSGRVLDGSGVPIPGALIGLGRGAPAFELIEPDGAPNRLVTQPIAVSVRTDAFGRYRVDHAPAGNVQVFVRAAGFSGTFESLRLDPGAALRRDFMLSVGAVLEGRVTDGGQAVAGVRVFVPAASVGTPIWFHPSTQTAGDGSYRLAGIQTGEVMVRVALEAPQPVRVLDGQRTTWNVDLTSLPLLSGRVVDLEGHPQAGLLVVRGDGEGPRARTDTDGRFQLAGLARIPSSVIVVDPAASVFQSIVVKQLDVLASASANIRIVVPLLARQLSQLRGQVLAQQDLVPGSTVLRLRASEYPLWVEFPVDAMGNVSVAGLTPGAYECRIQSESYAPLILPILRLGPAEIRDLGALRLERGGQLAVHLTEAGLPLEGQHGAVHLRVHARGVLIFSRDLVDPDFTTPELPVGPVTITVFGRGIPIVNAHAEIETGAVTDVELATDGAITRTVVVGRGIERMPRGEHFLRLIWGREGEAAIFDDYVFGDGVQAVVYQRLLPGKYTLQVRTSLGESGRLDFEQTTSARGPLALKLHD